MTNDTECNGIASKDQLVDIFWGQFLMCATYTVEADVKEEAIALCIRSLTENESKLQCKGDEDYQNTLNCVASCAAKADNLASKEDGPDKKITKAIYLAAWEATRAGIVAATGSHGLLCEDPPPEN